MTDKAIMRLAQIAHEYDLAGKPREADIIEDAMLRLSQSAVSNWWSGVKDVGRGIAQDAMVAGEIVAAPFEAAGAAINSAWNQGVKNAPAAWGQAADQAYGRVRDDTAKEFQDYAHAAPALAGPGGTGLPGAVVQDTLHDLQNGAQSYVGGIVNQQFQAQQEAYVQHLLQQAIQAHKINGTGWQFVQNAITYGTLSPDMQMQLKREFAAAAAQLSPSQH